MAVEVHIDRRSASAAPGTALFQVAEQLGVRVPTSCGGRGRCRECMVEVTAGADRLTPPGAEEDHLEEPLRLSCRARIAAGEGRVECHTLRRGQIQVVDEAFALPSAAATREPEPAVTRRGSAVFLDGEEIARWDGPLLGVAADLGTATVAVRLIDLESGEQLGSASFENPQRFGGSDVMARIQFDVEHPGQLLRRTLAGYLAHALADLGADSQALFEVVVAGNSTMRDLFFGLDVHCIGQVPFHSQTEVELRAGQRQSTHLSLPGNRSRLPLHPRGRLYGLPLVGCHVGADTAACLLALDVFEEERLVAVMDLGTNTELVIGRGKRLFAASCPAGPAFEGARLSCGMPALHGAIERIAIRDDGSVSYRVIGGGAPLGLCGSALIDVAGELLRTGRLNAVGRLTSGAERFWIDRDRGLFVSEWDLSLLAQAKAANAAGLHLVFRDYGIDFSDVDVFHLAGGFARHIDLGAARRIGLIPDLPDQRFAQVGNAALEGATRALLSARDRRRLEQQVQAVHHVELETFAEFFHFFAEGVQFAPFDTHDRGTEIVT